LTWRFIIQVDRAAVGFALLALASAGRSALWNRALSESPDLAGASGVPPSTAP
jgi:hypothetical protein